MYFTASLRNLWAPGKKIRQLGWSHLLSPWERESRRGLAWVGKLSHAGGEEDFSRRPCAQHYAIHAPPLLSKGLPTWAEQALPELAPAFRGWEPASRTRAARASATIPPGEAMGWGFRSPRLWLGRGVVEPLIHVGVFQGGIIRNRIPRCFAMFVPCLGIGAGSQQILHH